MEWIHEPDDSSNAPEMARGCTDFTTIDGLLDGSKHIKFDDNEVARIINNVINALHRSNILSKECTSSEITTAEQENIQNLDQTDNQNLPMQPGTSSQTQIDRSNCDMFSCDACAYQTKNMSKYIEHKQMHGNSHNFECSTCKRVYKRKALFVRHMNVKHKKSENDKTFLCNQCLFQTKYKHGLNKHRKTHANISDLTTQYKSVHKQSEEVIYSCNLCPFKTNYQSNLFLHRNGNGHQDTLPPVDLQVTWEETDRPGPSGYKSPKSSVTSQGDTAENLPTNRETEERESSAGSDVDANVPQKLHAPKAPNGAAESPALPSYCILYEQHFETEESSDLCNKDKHLRLICQNCHQQFPTCESLKKHIQMHKNKDAYICAICDKQYETKDSLNSHKQKHKSRLHNRSVGNKTFYCNLCEQYFETNKGFDWHNENKHPSVICYVCSKMFQTVKHLNLHMPIHNKISYDCNICGKQYKTKQTLYLHLQDHKNRLDQLSVSNDA